MWRRIQAASVCAQRAHSVGVSLARSINHHARTIPLTTRRIHSHATIKQQQQQPNTPTTTHQEEDNPPSPTSILPSPSSSSSSLSPSSPPPSASSLEPADLSLIFGRLSINWYPGHMHAAKQALLDRVSKCHLVLEVRDARIPFSSGNPEFDTILGTKKRIVICNKSDLADERTFDRVKAWFRSRGQQVLFMAGDPVVEKRNKKTNQTTKTNSNKKKKDVKSSSKDEDDDDEDTSSFEDQLSSLEDARKEESKHHVNRTQMRQLHQMIHEAIGKRKFASVPPVILVVGFPNTGKSTLINAFRSFSKIVAGSNASKSFLDSTKEETSKMQRGGVARVGSTPGVTRGISGFTVSSGIRGTKGKSDTDKLFLLDTPGIMLPYIPSTPSGVELGLKLSAINSIADLVVGDEILVRFMLWSLNRSNHVRYVEHLRPYLNGPTNDLNKLLIAIYRKKHSRVVSKSQLFQQFTKLTHEWRTATQYDEDGNVIDPARIAARQGNFSHDTPPASSSSSSSSDPSGSVPTSIGELTSEELMLCTSWFIKNYRRGAFGRITLDQTDNLEIMTLTHNNKGNSNTNHNKPNTPHKYNATQRKTG